MSFDMGKNNRKGFQESFFYNYVLMWAHVQLLCIFPFWATVSGLSLLFCLLNFLLHIQWVPPLLSVFWTIPIFLYEILLFNKHINATTSTSVYYINILNQCIYYQKSLFQLSICNAFKLPAKNFLELSEFYMNHVVIKHFELFDGTLLHNWLATRLL